MSFEPDDERLRSPDARGRQGPEVRPKKETSFSQRSSTFPQRSEDRPEVGIVEVLGAQGVARTEVEKIKIRDGIREVFPDDVELRSRRPPRPRGPRSAEESRGPARPRPRHDRPGNRARPRRRDLGRAHTKRLPSHRRDRRRISLRHRRQRRWTAKRSAAARASICRTARSQCCHPSSRPILRRSCRTATASAWRSKCTSTRRGMWAPIASSKP